MLGGILTGKCLHQDGGSKRGIACEKCASFLKTMLLKTFTLMTFTLLLSNCGQQTKNEKNIMTTEQRFAEWIERINQTEKFDNSIIGFNFGLFETTEGFEMYLIGSKTFDQEDEDWATNVDFEPKEKYFQFGQEFSTNKDWQDVLKYSEKLVQDYFNSDKFKTSIFVNAKGITTGFDDGNLTIIRQND